MLAIEILVQAVVVAGPISQQQRRRPRLAGGAAALEQLLVLEREGVAGAAEQRRPLVRDRREVAVERAAQLGDRVRERMLEVAIAAVAEAMAGHVDRRAEAAAVEQVGESFLAARRIEDIVLFDFHPGKLAAFGGNRVSLARELLLFDQ